MSASKVFIGALFTLAVSAPPLHATQPAEVRQAPAAQEEAAPATAAAPSAPAAATAAAPAAAAQQGGKGTIFTLWPLIDYRDSPATGYRNLSLLGPIFKFQTKGEERVRAMRPFFYTTEEPQDGTSRTDILYPIASRESSPDSDRLNILRLYTKDTYRKDEGAAREQGTTLFPFYITGTSKKYGPYRSVFPFYGDLYERFWRDEYHFVLFPLYGSTVKKGTTTKHYLWPFFSVTSGENESGYEVFPVYGQSHKDGVYNKTYALWPFFFKTDKGLDTDNPTHERFIFPYEALDSPKRTSRYYAWPFVGYIDDREKKFHETDYFWPFIHRTRGEGMHTDSFMPFYSEKVTPAGVKRWYAWPVYRHEEMISDLFRRDSDRILFFLYRDSVESWPKDGSSRRRNTLWPLYLYSRTPEGIRSFSFPAPVESVLDRDGIETNWAPLWRIYQRRWDAQGNCASTFLWNLFWHERRGDDLVYEVFPLVRYSSQKSGRDLRLLKGLISYKSGEAGRELSLLWLPGIKWGGK